MSAIQNILNEYQQCVNDIEDYFEYRYSNHTKEEIKKFVEDRIDQLTNSLKIK